MQTLDLSPTLLILYFPLPKTLSIGLLIVKIPTGREGGEITASASSLTYLSEYLTQWSPQPPPCWFHFSLTHKLLSISARRVKELKGWVCGEIISFVVADLLTWILDSAIFWYLHPPPPTLPPTFLISSYSQILVNWRADSKRTEGMGRLRGYWREYLNQWPSSTSTPTYWFHFSLFDKFLSSGPQRAKNEGTSRW